MYELVREPRNAYKALVWGVICGYVTATWTISLLHDDGGSAAHDIPASGTSLPHSDACPACRFLAGSNATEVPPSSYPIATPTEAAREASCACQVVITHFPRGPIILRGPPIVPLSSSDEVLVKTM